MLKDPKSHLHRLVQPLPIFAGFVARQVNYDLKVTVTKSSQTASKRSVSKFKLEIDGEGSKEQADALKDKIKASMDKFPTLKLNRGYIEATKPE